MLFQMEVCQLPEAAQAIGPMSVRIGQPRTKGHKHAKQE